MKGIKTAGSCIVIVLLVFIFAAGSMATTASISGSGTEGLVTITASAAFSTYEHCDDADPPNCTTCDSGHMWVTRQGTGHCHKTGNGSASCTFTVNAGVMPQGDHEFKVHVEDCDNLSVDEFYTLQIDNTPSLTVGNVAASDGWIDPSGGVDFKDNPSGNDGSVYVILDGDPKGYQYYEDAADWSWRESAGRAIIPATLSNGQHSLKIEARAANGAADSQEFPINIDNTPTIDIDDIEAINGSFDVGGSVAFTVHPTSFDGTVAVYFDDALQASAWMEESSWSYFQIANRLIDPTVLTNGPHTIKVVATAANQTQSEAQTTFNVDNTPKVTIDDIGKLEGFLDIKGEVKFQEATSRPDGTLSLYFDDGLLAVRNMEEPSWSYDELSGRKLNAAILSNGGHSVRLVARAHNGEQDTAQITFNIEPAHKLKIDQNKLQNCRSNILNLVNVL